MFNKFYNMKKKKEFPYIVTQMSQHSPKEHGKYRMERHVLCNYETIKVCLQVSCRLFVQIDGILLLCRNLDELGRCKWAGESSRKIDKDPMDLLELLNFVCFFESYDMIEKIHRFEELFTNLEKYWNFE
jgi:hypothetical protein